MILTLAVRHLMVRRLRALVLLAGFSLGVGVMIVLLSVGEAMVGQARDVSLVGGGEVTVLPEGIDIEAMRTGGVSGMFFGIDRARFVTRQVLGGTRQGGVVRTLSPAIEQKLLYLRAGGRVVPVRAGADVPSRARAVGTELQVIAGRWDDTPADSAWVNPTLQQLYDELDRFHLPPTPDSTWAEWHYFNVVAGPEEWWYITYLVAGEVPDGRWGGQLLMTRRRPDGRYERYRSDVAAPQVRFDTMRADVRLGRSTVVQRNGRYTLQGRGTGPDGVATIDLVLTPDPARYFPPVELRGDDVYSGYVVPAIRAEASGRLCARDACRTVSAAPAYHDHNWGTWRDVTWEWGIGRGQRFDLLYGGVRTPGDSLDASPFFLALADSTGVRQVLHVADIEWQGSESLRLLAVRGADRVRLRMRTSSAQATVQPGRRFLQVRGQFSFEGILADQAISDSGSGFFETYLPAAVAR